MNWLAILCAGLAYFFLGFIWFSVIFGGALRREGDPRADGPPIAPKLVSTFVSTTVAAFVMSYILRLTGITDRGQAVLLGVAIGVGLVGTAQTMNAVWESRSTTWWAIHFGYYLVGSILLALILVSWP